MDCGEQERISPQGAGGTSLDERLDVEKFEDVDLEFKRERFCQRGLNTGAAGVARSDGVQCYRKCTGGAC